MAPRIGWKHSAEAKARITEAMRKRYRERPDIAKRMWEGSKRPRSSETKQRMAAAQAKPYEFLNDLSTVEWAYIAGLFDGEGTINIVRRVGRDGRCFLVMSLVNTHKPIIEWLKSKLRGNIAGGSPMRDPRWKKAWKWSATQTHAAAIITKLRPFLIIKKRAADLALLFQQERFSSLENQSALKSKMSEINQRGAPA